MKNVLIIMTDQLRRDVLGCYGGKEVETPYRFAGGGRDTAGELLYTQCGMYAFQRVLYDGKISP